MDVSVGGWWLCGFMNGCVGSLVVVGWVFGCLSLGGWWLGSSVDGCVGRCVVVGWLCEWMCC